ncbi:MAG: Rne/Rng family ribonuclease [Bacteroidales bacterium]|nr:Rne/Rng family ribonuclease [Bacteroidales bacterium]
MSSELAIKASEKEVSIALLEDKRLVELNHSQPEQKFSVGDIYLARVKKIMPSLNAAFINVGYEKDAFLHYLDLGPQFSTLGKYVNQSINRRGRSIAVSKFKREKDINKHGKINEVLKAGKIVLVQVAKEPISTKGPRLTSEISIAGRNLVLMPFSDKVSISSKISSQEERDRLRNLITSIRPNNYGVIVRTVAEKTKVAELDIELRTLVRKFEKALESINIKDLPQLVIEEQSRATSVIRDHLNGNFENIFIDNREVYQEVKQYISEVAPEKEKIVKLYSGKQSLFEKFDIERQIKTSFGNTVSFKQGAYLIIEHTEALHVIDVNSGNRSKSGLDQESNATEVNLAATEEIARQLRLRDMGGIIVVDFIDMHKSDNKQKVYDRMKEVMSKDKTKHNILPLSKFGLMQITRQRVRPEMHVETAESCPTCNGTGKVQPTILLEDSVKLELVALISQNSLKKITLQAHPYFAAYLQHGRRSVIRQWRKEMKCRITVESLASCSLHEFIILDINGDQLLRKTKM